MGVGLLLSSSPFTDEETEVPRVYIVSWDPNPGRQVPEAIYTMLSLDIVGSLKAQRMS